jgi:hypothetical protein
VVDGFGAVHGLMDGETVEQVQRTAAGSDDLVAAGSKQWQQHSTEDTASTRNEYAHD